MRPPGYEGTARVWVVDFHPTESQNVHYEEFGHTHTGIRSCLIQGPYHPMWSWWFLGAVSLRDQIGVPPVTKLYPEAEFEILIMSIDPEGCDPDVDAMEDGRMKERGFTGFLEPPDLHFQGHGATNDEVQLVVDSMLMKIADGVSCDRDLRRYWNDFLTGEFGEGTTANL